MYTVGGPEEVAKSHIRINLLMYCQRSKWPFQPTLRRHVLLSPLGYLAWELPCSHHWHTFVRIKLDIHTSKVSWFSKYLLLLNRHPEKTAFDQGQRLHPLICVFWQGEELPLSKYKCTAGEVPASAFCEVFFCCFFVQPTGLYTLLQSKRE